MAHKTKPPIIGPSLGHHPYMMQMYSVPTGAQAFKGNN
jgi:hypothetical protein